MLFLLFTNMAVLGLHFVLSALYILKNNKFSLQFLGPSMGQIIGIKLSNLLFYYRFNFNV